MSDAPLKPNAKIGLALSTFALGPNGHKLLREQLSEERRPTASDCRLEVTLLWGDTIVDVQTYVPGETVLIGPTPSSDFRVHEDRLPEIFSLVADDAVHAPAGSAVVLFCEGQQVQGLIAGAGRLSLGDRAWVAIGTIHFIIRWIRPSPERKTSLFDSVDASFTKVLSLAFMVQLVLFAGFWITPLGNDLLSEELFKNPQALVKTVVRPSIKPRDPKHVLAGAVEGSRPREADGKKGKPDAKKTDAAPPKKGTRIVDAVKREKDHRLVMATGLLTGLQGPLGAISTIFGSSSLGTGINDALGGLKGAGAGDAFGMAGLGSRGDGPGGGGRAFGIGSIGSHFGGSGRGGYGTVDLGGRGKEIVRVIPGSTHVQGSLSKDVIAAIVHRHENEIRYCYEAELNRNPALYGKVSVAWTIDGTGGVSEANVGETTMNNANVENCMATKIRRWKFPEPKGGGEVFVTYPWVFKSSAEE